eukprot:320967_1
MSKYRQWLLMLSAISILLLLLLGTQISDLNHLPETMHKNTSFSPNINTTQSFPPHCLSANEGISLLSSNDSEIFRIRNTILQHKLPPFLISFGGSGNTFVRLLIEYITKIYTGSVYRGEFKALGYVGSDYFSTETIVVKIHGNHFDISNINSDWNGSAIFLVRNPWDAMFALFNLWAGRSGHYNRHQNHIQLKGYQTAKFKNFLKRRCIKKWNKNFKVLNAIRTQNKSHIIVKFENIASPNIDVKTNEILKIIKYLYRKEYYAKNKDLFKYRINCLWNISKTDKRLKSIHRTKPTADQLNKTLAFQLLDRKFICKLWAKMKPYTSEFGYYVWNNVSCD